VVTGNRRGYFGDFGRVADVATAIADGFVYQGQHAPHRRRRHGAPAAGDAGDRFVSFIQNHDQVANAYQGQRIAQVAGPARQKVAATVLFSTPSLPLLFQGEEWAEEAPFDYFTSHGDPALAEAVRKGRHEEYVHLLHEGAGMGTWADPQAEETFRRCKLRWESIERAPHAEMLAFYRTLIALRRRLAPLSNGRKDLTRVASDEEARWLTILRGDPSGAATFTCATLADTPARVPVPEGAWKLALATEPSVAVSATVGGGDFVTLPPSTALIYERRPR
jgi:maltooligosyltrehalose trehalohydrolase